MDNEGSLLIVQELQGHPNSVVKQITQRFEKPSIVKVYRNTELRPYSKPPLFDKKYLLLINDLKALEECLVYFNFETMFPVITAEYSTETSDIIFLCKNKNLPFKIIYNDFTKAQAYSLITSIAEVQVSKTFCDTLIRQTGLHPMRIVMALSVCSQLGYTSSIITKYIDKWTYPATRKTIESLLHVAKTKTARQSALSYIYNNRRWYRYVKNTLLKEVSMILQVYLAKSKGELTEDNTVSYSETNKIPRRKVLYALELFEYVSVSDILALREFLKDSTVMDITLALT